MVFGRTLLARADDAGDRGAGRGGARRRARRCAARTASCGCSVGSGARAGARPRRRCSSSRASPASDFDLPRALRRLRARRRAVLVPRPDPGAEVRRADRRRRRLGGDRAVGASLRAGGLADREVAASSAAAGRSTPATADGLSELDGQLLLGLGRGRRTRTRRTSSPRPRRRRRQGGTPRRRRSYGRCLAIDPGDAVAAFNRANCLRAAGRAGRGRGRATRGRCGSTPGFVEAWFNLAGLLAARGRRDVGAAASRAGDRARCRLCRCGLQPRDARVRGRRPRRGAALWERYLELDRDSEWARQAARGVQFVACRRAGSAG